MNNDVLQAFIHVIDCGSLSKAAEKMHLSATALMKQMTLLEARVGVRLLIRTNHGVRATDAGNSFYHDAKFMLQYSEKAIVRSRQAADQDPYVIRIGNSMLYPCKVLLDVWNTISATYPQFKMKIVPIGTDAEVWPAQPTLGKDIDVIVGAYERAPGPSAFRECKLGEYRFCVAVSREHRLARQAVIAITDLYGERVVMLQPGISPIIDGIRAYLLAEHPNIQIKSMHNGYTIDVFNRCEENGAVLLTLAGWKDVHPALATIPVDWEYTIPYGVICSIKPGGSVLLFLRALQEGVL